MAATSPDRSGSLLQSLNGNASAPKKPARKKKDLNPEEAAALAAKVKDAKDAKKPVVRKPRAPKDPNAPPVQRKRKAPGDSLPAAAAVASAAGSQQNSPATVAMSAPAQQQHAADAKTSSDPFPRQHKITDLVSPSHPPQHSASATSIPRDPPTPNARPASSGRMFDPIRGATVDKPPVSPTPPPSASLLSRASASPAIKSLMNPVAATEASRKEPASPSIAMSRQPSGNSIASVLSSMPPSSLPAQVKAAPVPTKSNLVPTKSRQQEETVVARPKKVEAVSAPPSNAPTPPQKPKISREVPPLPTGSGLLSGTPFGLTAAPNGNGNPALPGGTNIWLKFDLKGKENVTINFAHEVEKKYGAAALNPRLAARKERQRQLALAGAALEKELGESVEDMSIDMSEPESNNDTDGPAKDGTDGEPAKKKRKRRTEDYDRNDDFIDDEEVLLEEQALMTKDGFFVYSGPLIQEGERPAVERADGTIRRGGSRARGGRRGGAGAAAGTGGESGRAAAGAGAGGAAAKRGGGGAAAAKAAGANGGVRKARATKADKAANKDKGAAAAAAAATSASLAVAPAVPAAVTAAS